MAGKHCFVFLASHQPLKCLGQVPFVLGTVQSRKMTPCPQEHVISLDNRQKKIKAVSNLWSGEISFSSAK